MEKEYFGGEAFQMIRLFIYCEGQTEASFVNRLLSERLLRNKILAKPIIAETSRTHTKKHKGGLSKYKKIRPEIEKLCNDKSSYVTTMLDFYGLPNDVPGRRNPIGKNIYEKVCYVENEIAKDIAQSNFIPNVILHEFEGLLFSNPNCFSYCSKKQTQIDKIIKIRNDHETPEHINDGVSTAPSKIILKIFPDYDKVVDGVNIAIDVGIEQIIKECYHFKEWVHRLEELRGIAT